MTDTQLIEFIGSENNGLRNKGFSYLVERDYGAIQKFVEQNSGSSEDAKDVFQEGLIALLRNIQNGSFRSSSTIKSYLYSICKNLWLQQLRKMERNTVKLEQTFEQEDTTQPTEMDERFSVVREKFNSLGEECQKILIQFYYKKRSMKYLQEYYNLGSAQAAKNKKSRCLKKLSTMID